MKVALLLASLLLSACAISGGPSLSSGSILANDLMDAAFNLDEAVRVGALPVDDPAPKCMHAILVQAGLELPPGAKPIESFDPKRTGIVSEATAIYIRAQQVKVLAALRQSTDPACQALVGKIVIESTQTANKALLNGFIPGINLR